MKSRYDATVIGAGQLAEVPLIVAWNESTIDPSRAPAGKCLMKFVVLGVPWQITGDATGKVDAREWDVAKEPYAAHLLEKIDRDYRPGLRAQILKCTTHSPVDLHRKLRSAVRGTISHGAMLPYQKGSMRPVPGLASTAPRCRTSTSATPAATRAPGFPWPQVTMPRRSSSRICTFEPTGPALSKGHCPGTL